MDNNTLYVGALIGALGLVGCVADEDELIAQPEPIEVDFRDVDLGATVTRIVVLPNTGVESIVQDEPFAEAFTFEFDGSASITIDFTPQESGEAEGGLIVHFAESELVQRISIRGRGVPVPTGPEPKLRIVPNTVDFGAVALHCEGRQTIEVVNRGWTDAVVDSVRIAPANPAFSIAQLPSPLPGAPLVLSPGTSVEVALGFVPDRATAYSAGVEAIESSSGSAVSVGIWLEGSGRDEREIDVFQQLNQPKVDLLFVIDNTRSMADEQMSMAQNFRALIEDLTARGPFDAFDYQLGVITTSGAPGAGRLVHPTGPADLFGGPFANRIVTPRTLPTPESVFLTNVELGAEAPDEALDESGFEAAHLALTEPNLSGANAGFLRADASLVIVFVSDGPERSSRAFEFYSAFFSNVMGGGAQVSIAAIVGDEPKGCAGPGGVASSGGRYHGLWMTGGSFVSICDAGWHFRLPSSFGYKNRFRLSDQPDGSTIEVFVGAVNVPASTGAWTYDRATNSVTFTSSAMPAPGSTIRIEYTVCPP